MEPTGHYWFSLANWLVEQRLSVVLVNPVTSQPQSQKSELPSSLRAWS
ncbi:hypothetical protein [Paenibacillus sp. cl123]